MEPFIRHLNNLTSNASSYIGLVTSNHGLKISNLYFADDCLLFAQATMEGQSSKISGWKSNSSFQSRKTNPHKFSNSKYATIPHGMFSLF